MGDQASSQRETLFKIRSAELADFSDVACWPVASVDAMKLHVGS
ncbi:hypothetical protein NK6_9784 [Bradyrhizobium diazoefficiens]|uniref:Uncharacterized protein n=1 Tax=Bradyrhizobium diazoefficiens TaxID=1355477 RepID=A0A0E4BY48_9BRAD|nr:hypothetical protein NK6_9784 [Bradyrhizobium diazoefficiens]